MVTSQQQGYVSFQDSMLGKALQGVISQISDAVFPQKIISPLAQGQSQANSTQSPVKQALDILNPQKTNVAQAQIAEPPKGATPYEVSATPIFDKYGVPPAVAMGIYAMEGRGKTINPNNPYNIGAYDTNPQNANAYGFKDPMEGTEEAAKFLAGQSDYMAPDKKQIFQQALSQYKKTHDQETYLKTIAPTYSSNPQYAQTIMQTPEFQRWSYNN